MEGTPLSESLSDDLNIIVDLSQTLGAATNVTDLLKRSIEAAVQLVPANTGLIALMDHDTDQLVVRAMVNEGEFMAREESIVVTDPLLHESMLDQSVYRVGASDADSYDSGYPTLIVPMVFRGDGIGVISLTREPSMGYFTEPEQSALVVLTSYAASAIQNATLYERTAAVNHELQMLVEASNAVSSSLDLASVLSAITRYMMHLMDGQWCIISDWEPNTHTLHRLAENRRVYWAEGNPVHPEQPGNSVRLHAMDRGIPYNISISEDRGNPEKVALLQELQLSRVMGAPIQVDGEVLGLIEVGSTHVRVPFPPGRRNRLMRKAIALTETITDLSLLSEYDALVETAASSLGAHDGADWCTIYRWDEQTNQLSRLLSFGYSVWSEEDDPPTLTINELPTLNVVMEEQRIAEMRRTNPNLSASEAAIFEETGLGVMLALPLVYKHRTVGLIRLFDVDPHRTFNERELGLANMMARQAAIALENARLVRDLQRRMEDVRAMQAQLVRSARLAVLGELSEMLAHQISNPLTVVLGDAELLVADLPPGSDRESALAIKRAGERAQQVVERVLRNARQEEDPELIDVAKTITDTLELVTPQFRRRGITLQPNIDEALPPVRGIVGQLEDIWSNLLINARDAVAEAQRRDGLVTIDATHHPQDYTIVVTVTDNGTGIPEDKLEKIYDPSYTTKPQGQGTGLGMYVVRQILDALSASIDVESTVGMGTRMIVTLPVYRLLESE